MSRPGRLAAPVHTRRLGAQNGTPFVTDGPYAETQEVLAGYWIVECDSFDRATEIASRLSACPAPEHVVANAYADVRPIMESQPTRDQRTDQHGLSCRGGLMSRACCASWRRRFLVPSYAAMETSITAEDAVQEALLAAATQWPTDGVPDNPKGWLITVAARRLTDLLRSEQARRRREDTVARWELPRQQADTADSTADSDDTLILLFMCCHPALSAPSQIALTLRAVGGLTTGEVARAFLVSEATMTRRITRAKQQIKDSGIPFRLPAPGRARRPTGGRSCTCST